MTSTEGSGEVAGRVRVELVRGLAGVPRDQREVVRGLGLRRIGSVVSRPDTPTTRGMVRRVAHLVRVTETPDERGSQ